MRDKIGTKQRPDKIRQTRQRQHRDKAETRQDKTKRRQDKRR